MLIASPFHSALGVISIVSSQRFDEVDEYDHEENPMSTREQVVTDLSQAAPDTAGSDAGIEADSLVEEVSIDGMCGVY
jgi:mycofactocin precursor